jgi:peptidoglycan/xylan/chitin deacetylase (PgdA/CDA1 family)
MKLKHIATVYFLLLTSLIFSQNSWIRINQLGYQNQAIKVAVFVSHDNIDLQKFDLIDANSNKKVFTFSTIKSFGSYTSFKSSFRLNFSEYQKNGEYYISANGINSPTFRIGKDIYSGSADFLLNYMRQQRCGYNPFLQDSCHTEDGFIVDNPENDSAYVNVKGGWHDASDYLQYLTTSANATYQMLFAYQQNPESFRDMFDADGNKGSNGIPDIVDEAKWGLDWLVKMNPEYGVMYNQIADDRDHAGYRLPNNDSVNYGKGFERPIYLVTGKKQGLAKYKNRTTGVSSTAGKYASAFALGSEIMEKFYPEFSEKIVKKAIDAYEYAKSDLGVTQTASNKSPYFYEEDNYVDDLELAAIQLYKLTGEEQYLKEAVEWGSVEPITPWMGLDTARHYQWYPFVNLGHYLLADEKNNNQSTLFKFNLKKGLTKIYNRGKDNPFLFGVPFIWCSNNLVAAAITQAHLYQNITNDKRFAEMEAALRDWLFGCNPWGTSMIVEYPKNGDYPEDTHSAFCVLENIQPAGGLVDGPVYTNIFKRLLGLHLTDEDEYSAFQSDLVVYHDDNGDYSTNEPTMDGTASLSYYLSALEKEGLAHKPKKEVKSFGGIIRSDQSKKNIYLMFSGGDYNDGGIHIIDVLDEHDVKAHFFFTGDFYRNKNNKEFLLELVDQDHYVGAHSDKHLLYVPWENRDSLLVTKEEFIADIDNNYREMKKFGIKKSEAPFYLPPYEWYNNTIAEWTEETGLKLVSFSPGTRSNADYTIPSMGDNYVSSDDIYKTILEYEQKSEFGLNGFHLFLHVGTHPERTDKFYNKLDELIRELKSKGYSFKLLHF